MTRAAVNIDELPTETKNQIKKRLRPDRDSLTRAAVGVLSALDQTGIAVREWPRVLELVRKWLRA